MAELIDQKFTQWTQARKALQARITVYYMVRDIPYAVIPELNDGERYVDILKHRKGSCMPKHFLLRNMFERLGMLVLYVVYPFRWDEVEIDYPPQLINLARELPTSHHLACKVDIDGEFILVDATVDPGLKKLGLHVNEEWDGVSNTVLPINPCGEEQIYHPSEASLMPAQYDEKSLAFYGELNRWLEVVRGP